MSVISFLRSFARELSFLHLFSVHRNSTGLYFDNEYTCNACRGKRPDCDACVEGVTKTILEDEHFRSEVSCCDLGTFVTDALAHFDVELAAEDELSLRPDCLYVVEFGISRESHTMVLSTTSEFVTVVNLYGGDPKTYTRTHKYEEFMRLWQTGQTKEDVEDLIGIWLDPGSLPPYRILSPYIGALSLDQLSNGMFVEYVTNVIRPYFSSRPYIDQLINNMNQFDS